MDTEEILKRIDRLERLEKNQKVMLRRLEELQGRLEELHHALTRQKGFLGGILFAITAIVTFFELVKLWFLHQNGN